MLSPQLKSPFKFLDPYGPQDSEIFFGRKDEEDLLYQYINKNRLVLVYGTSGTGKTSLVQCGLSKRLEVTDWVPFYIRRGNNINESLSRAIHGCKAMQDSDIVPDNNGSLLHALEQVNVYYLRPVYLIFDQFEELLILGDEDEKAFFIKLVHTIFTSPETKFCSLLFILREEYFAWMEPFEKLIPGFSDRRLRVENMRPQQVKEVILDSCKAFNIELEDETGNVDQIIDTVANKTNIPLPYLQVYLDQLWREDYKRTYPNGYSGQGYPPLKITTKEIEACGEIKDVLQRFLVERKDAIQKELKAQFPILPDNFTAKVLDSFVSFKGTKRPLAYQVQRDVIVLSQDTAPELADLPEDALHNCLTELERSRILRMDGSYIELAHDVLAALIDDMRSDMERRLNEIRYQISNRREEYRYTGDVLSPKELNYYDEYLEKLNLSDELMQFYRYSQNKRAEEEKNNLGLKKQLHRRKLFGYLGLALIPVVALLFFAYRKTTHDSNRNLGLLFLASKLKTAGTLNALNMIPLIQKRLYAEDSAAVNATLLEYMQSQDVQSRFSMYNDTLISTSLAESEVSISPDGNYMAYLDKRDTSWLLRSLRDTSKKVRFRDVDYLYFMNGAATVMIAKKYTPPQTATNNVLTSNFAGLPRDLIIFDCIAWRTQANIQFKPKQFLYPFRFVFRRNEREYDSYRVRSLSNGNLLMPFVEIDNYGIQKGKVMLLRSDGEVLQELPSELSISTSKDNFQFMTGTRFIDNKFDLNTYNAHGQRTAVINGASFSDFTNDGGVIYKMQDVLYVYKGADTFRTVAPRSRYAHADISKDFLLMEINASGTPDTLIMQRLSGGNAITYLEKLVGINYDKQVFITQWRKRPFNYDQPPPSTFYKRRLHGGQVFSYTVPEGVQKVMYNSAADELMIQTATNRLILLRSNMTVKTAFQITANDMSGISRNGQKFFYVRDQYLSVFRNDSALANVFDPLQSAKLLSAASPIYRPVPQDTLRKYGLIFK